MIDDFYRVLEERFRSSQAVIRQRLQVYQPFLQALRQEVAQPRALDIGCGRGEWLQLLVENGFEARGVDLDDSMLEACHERGLNAENLDALKALQALPDNSLDLISSFHVVEHLTFDYLRELLQETQRVLSPQGLLILETPNIENLSVGTCDFWLDPTHVQPLPPVFLEFLCQYSGFERCKILRLQEDPALREPDASIGLVDVLFRASPDYAVVARKALPAPEQIDPFAELFAKDFGIKLDTLAGRYDEIIDLRIESTDLRVEQLGHDFDERLEQQRVRMEQSFQAHEVLLQEHQARLIKHEARLDQKADRLQQQEERLYAWYAESIERATKADQQLLDLYSSSSWRLTRPLRGVVRLVREPGFFKLTVKRAALLPLNSGLRYVRSKRRFMGVLKSVVERVPALDKRFRAYQASLEKAVSDIAIPADPISNYSPRVEYLQRHLVKLVRHDAPVIIDQASSDSLPRLAYVSPLPPERTGIADYSAELLPALAAYYQIDLIVEQPLVEGQWLHEHCQVHDADWLREHADQYDAVLYHIGNSSYHSFMVELMEEVPGIVVLHDFFISDLNRTMSARDNSHRQTLQTLYYGHGYPALVDPLAESTSFDYPVNRKMLQQAKGVIVHSEVSLRLARQWYGEDAGADWSLVPLLRERAAEQNREELRSLLDLPQDAFVICSFGLLGITKLNHRLVRAWLDSELALDPTCMLVLVGVAGETPYCKEVLQTIADSGLGARIRVTGWCDNTTFKQYLACADLAVQLRTLSRGETSATVLDCMNNRLPAIVNANGSMADLSPLAVYRLDDEFEDADLTRAIEQLWRDPQARRDLGEQGRAIIEEQHDPDYCAGLYHVAISKFTQRAEQRDVQLREAIKQLPAPVLEAARHQDPAHEQVVNDALLALADQLLQGQPDPLQPRQLLLDITATCQVDRQTGIERVARALTLALLAEPPAGYRIEPVYLVFSGGQWHYRYATAYTAGLLDLSKELADQGVDFAPGDQLVTLDVSGQSLVLASQAGVIKRLQEHGVTCKALVFDLLPVLNPEFFPPNANVHFADWLATVAHFDGVICISDTVAQDMHKWVKVNAPERLDVLTIEHFHLGADLAHTAPTMGLPDNAAQVLKSLASCPSVLMVGTLEPRKGYLQAVEAFSELWENGVNVNLVIVGRAGWQQLPQDQQRTIPKLLERLNNHPQKGKHLFWLDGISDEFLEQVYSGVSGLLAASENEGFGLPLIEAAQKGLPILARDIPVFREVAGEHAFYFKADEPAQLAAAITQWLEQGCQPTSTAMPWLTWRQSADNLQHLLLKDLSPEVLVHAIENAQQTAL